MSVNMEALLSDGPEMTPEAEGAREALMNSAMAKYSLEQASAAAVNAGIGTGEAGYVGGGAQRERAAGHIQS